MLYPKSPGSLIWPVEHSILAILIVIGAVLYYTRRNEKGAIEGPESTKATTTV
jgi:hypothetical protein